MRYAEFNMKNETTYVDFAMDGPIMAKVAAMVSLAVTSFLLGILPIKLASILKWNTSETHGHGHGTPQCLPVYILLSFGGGVLLYTTFMHLQPEVREGMEVVSKTGIIPHSLLDSGLNLSELIFCLGFFFVYLIEELVHSLLDRTKDEEDMLALHRSISIRKKCRAGNLIPRIQLPQPNQSPPSTITASTQVLIKDSFYKKNSIDPVENMIPPTNVFAPSEAGSDRTLPNDTANSVAKSFRGLIAVVALSFHAVFEGLAVGLEKDTANVWYLCAAVATHKLVIAFCVGVELVSTGTKKLLVVLYMATFALVTPLGIGIGLGMTYHESSLESPQMALASVILQGLASGTLLYVVFFEVLQREKLGRHGMVQFLSIMAGFIVMVGLSLIIGHHHHHHHHHHDHGHDHVHDHDEGINDHS
ncbi:zinc transporter ZIP3-like [Cimex lectularius]|uniref:Uncharacterized protein n=1 Tax=Cimex lectularius TaxID=79782 RepID=A0A8I6RRP5_CIMLE|nr:zinc transporter ZIP3-like [Cimex lectularius]